MKKNILMVALLLAASFGHAQEYVFKVLANKGANEVKSADAWVPVKTGASLNSTDELKIADNAYLGLVHKSGRPMEVKQAGSYKIADLAAKLGTGNSVVNKYTDFILSSNSEEGKKNRMAATGSVTRGLSSIKVNMPAAQYSGIYNDKMVINWEPAKNEEGLIREGLTYVATIMDMEDNVLSTAETTDTQVTVNLGDGKFKNQSAVLVVVQIKGDSKSISERHVIKRLNTANREKIKNALTTDLGVSPESESAMDKMVLALFYEQNGLILDAITAYQDAIKMAPDVQDYKNAYQEFLQIKGIKKEDKK
jgi:hypothetical protein